MRLTPRGTEVAAIAELLESDEFDSAEALSKAIIKRVADLFSEREWYVWVYRENPEAWYLPYGIFSSETEAKKSAGKMVDMLKGQHMILHVFSYAELVARIASYKVPSQFCANCEHSHISHQHPRKNGRCAVRNCKCKKDVAE
jgi:hypothetical protein